VPSHQLQTIPIT
jgi:hypothetical protein